ncbi:hypothetical protein Tco_0321885 [Tanacetum coccineum]
MFRQTLNGATRNWFNDLDPKSVDNFEELSQKFLEEFSQQKRYAKDPMEIHGIKRRMNEVMDIRNWPKKLNDKIPKTADEMFERVRAFIKGEAAAGKDHGKKRSKGVPKEYGNVCPLLKKGHVHTPHQNAKGNFGNGKCELPGTSTASGNSRKTKYEQVLKAGPLGERYTLRQSEKRKSKMRVNDSHKHVIDADVKSRLRKANAPLVGFSGVTYHPSGLIDLRVTMGESGKSKTVLLEFAVVKCRSPYNVILGRTGMRSLRAVGSTIHSMIKFPTTKGVATIKTSKEALWECRQIERMHSSWKEAQWCQHKEQMSKIREQPILRARSIPNRKAEKEPMITEETWEEDTLREKVIIHNSMI